MPAKEFENIRPMVMAGFAKLVDEVKNNLEKHLGKSQPTISHHTRILAEAGLIVGEKRGRWTYWRIVAERRVAAARILV